MVSTTEAVIVPKRKGAQGLTFEERIRTLDALAESFVDHLKTRSGVFLTPALRLAVVTCAQQEAPSCKVCNDLPDSFPHKHTASSVIFPASESTTTTAVKEDVLTDIVHAIVRYQSSLDKVWFDATIEAIKTCGVISAAFLEREDEESITLSCCAVLCEVLALTTMSHALHVLYVALGRDPPTLPTMDDMIESAPPPMEIRYRALLSNVRRDPVASEWMPFFLWKDVDKNGSEFHKLGTFATDGLSAHFNSSAPPHTNLSFAMDDAVMATHFLFVLYPPSVYRIWPWQKQNPNHCCSGSVSRYQIECVAAAVAEAYHCGF